MKILVISAYDTPSHKYWREGIVDAFPEHIFTVCTLPARFFAWRLRGSALSLTLENAQQLAQTYDCILATSMVDLASLKGLNPNLAVTPCILYFHENQFEYPSSKSEHHSIDAQMVNIYSALAADYVVFNSEYNRQTLVAGVKTLARKLPDYVPRNLHEKLINKSQVLAVPLMETSALEAENNIAKLERDDLSPLKVVWNHRWEYDKGPDRLLALIRALSSKSNIRFTLLGQQFRKTPREMSDVIQLLRARNWLTHSGYVESKDEFLYLLQSSDVVLSTALHDFQGLSVMEAVEQNCVPVLPCRLAYREYFSSQYLYQSYPNDVSSEAQSAANMLQRLAKEKASGIPFVAPSLRHLSWSSLRGDYNALFQRTQI